MPAACLAFESKAYRALQLPALLPWPLTPALLPPPSPPPDGRGNEALAGIKCVTQVLQDTSELVAICLVAWSVRRLKDRIMVAMQLSALRSSDDKHQNQVARLLEGAGSALDYMIFVVAAFTALSAYGVNIRPIVASLGASSVIVGLAAQNLLASSQYLLCMRDAPQFLIFPFFPPS